MIFRNRTDSKTRIDRDLSSRRWVKHHSIGSCDKNGQLPADFTQNQRDRSFFACDAYKIEPLIAQIVQRAKAKGFTPQDIQVLAPMYRGAAGIDALNKMMQEIFNPNDGTKKKSLGMKQSTGSEIKFCSWSIRQKTMFSMGIWDKSSALFLPNSQKTKLTN